MSKRFGDTSRSGDYYSDLFWTNQQNRASGNLEGIWVMQYDYLTPGAGDKKILIFVYGDPVLILLHSLMGKRCWCAIHWDVCLVVLYVQQIMLIMRFGLIRMTCAILFIILKVDFG